MSDRNVLGLKILLVTGGNDAEREISLKSARQVQQALQTAGHNVLFIDLDPNDLSCFENGTFDIVFTMMHGPFGEGGPLQTILQNKALKFTGCNASSSALAMNKHQAKVAMTKAGLLVPPGILFGKTTLEPADHFIQIKTALSYFVADHQAKIVVKPNSDGSSVGVTIADNIEVAANAIYNGLVKFDQMLAELFITGRELTVGILGEKVLPIIEIKSATSFYDFDAKYLKDDTQYLFELDIGPELIEKIQNQALKAFKALGCRDLGRVDFLLPKDGAPVVLEINTIPGMTDHSLLPMACEKIGINMPTLCDQIAQFALNRPINP